MTNPNRGVYVVGPVRRQIIFDKESKFAKDEGEGDGSLDAWRKEHAAYFERNGGFSPNMLLVCERFKVVE